MSRREYALSFATIGLVVGAGAFAVIQLLATYGGSYGGVVLLAFFSAVGGAIAVVALVVRMARGGDGAPLYAWVLIGLFAAIGLGVSGLGFGLRG